MADGKETYPTIPEKNWWDLRKKFKQSPPVSGVSTDYLSNLLNISTKAAANIRPTLKRIGVIDENGSVQERAYKWRDDEQYKVVCAEILSEIYPQELLDLYPKPTNEDKDSIARWFANKSKVGTAASKMMASFFILLCDANPEVESEVRAKPKTEKPREKSITAPTARKAAKTHIKGKGDEEQGLNTPSININVEVHISSDASDTQIDKIFESMATHLNIRRKIANE